VKENRRRDVVRHVPDERIGSPGESSDVRLQNVSFDDLDVRARVLLAQQLRELSIVFDRDYTTRALLENLGQRATPWPDLDDGFLRRELQSVRDAREDRSVSEKMLAEAFSDWR
jgi:hypothetical protein